MAEMTVTQAWSAVMKSVTSVGKDDVNQQQGFRFRGIDATINAVGPALREHGVMVVPSRILDEKATEYTTGRNNTRMVNRVVLVEYTVWGPGGDCFVGQAIGEAADSGDKAMTKAQSVAYRTFLLQALCIPTGDPDPDSESHERTSGARDTKAVSEANRKLREGNEARGEILTKLEPYGWTGEKLVKRFHDDYGADLLAADAATVRAFGSALEDEAKAQEASDAAS